MRAAKPKDPGPAAGLANGRGQGPRLRRHRVRGGGVQRHSRGAETAGGRHRRGVRPPRRRLRRGHRLRTLRRTRGLFRGRFPTRRGVHFFAQRGVLVVGSARRARGGHERDRPRSLRRAGPPGGLVATYESELPTWSPSRSASKLWSQPLFVVAMGLIAVYQFYRQKNGGGFGGGGMGGGDGVRRAGRRARPPRRSRSCAPRGWTRARWGIWAAAAAAARGALRNGRRGTRTSTRPRSGGRWRAAGSGARRRGGREGAGGGGGARVYTFF